MSAWKCRFLLSDSLVSEGGTSCGPMPTPKAVRGGCWDQSAVSAMRYSPSLPLIGAGVGAGYDSAIGCRNVIGAGGVQRAWAGQGTCAGPSGNRRAAARETRGGGRHVPGRGRPAWRVGLQVRRPVLGSGWERNCNHVAGGRPCRCGGCGSWLP